MAAVDTLSKDHHLRATATIRVLPYVPLMIHALSRPFFLFSPTAVPGHSLRLVARFHRLRVRLDNKSDDTQRHTRQNDKKRKKNRIFGLTFSLENEQMQYEQGPPQQVIVKEKKKNQGCLAVW